MAAAVQKVLLLLMTNPELPWLSCTYIRPLEHNGSVLLYSHQVRAASNDKHRNEDGMLTGRSETGLFIIHRRTYLQLSDADYVHNNTRGICSRWSL